MIMRTHDRFKKLHPEIILLTHLISTFSDDTSGKWADELIDIVSEPLDRTIERMKKFSTSTSNVGKCY